MTKPLIQIADDIREMTDDEYADWLTITKSAIYDADEEASAEDTPAEEPATEEPAPDPE